MNNPTLTGYGPSNQWQNLIFNGDESKFEIWETKLLGYMKIKKLKDVLVGDDEPDAERNEMAFAEMIQFLEERSFSLVIRDANDNGRKAFKILKAHYAGSGKPRIITLYNQLTSLKKSSSESLTDFILRTETSATALKTCSENISDALLIAMVLKGLPDDYGTFVAVVTQSETVDTFTKFKIALRNFEETENAKVKDKDDNSAVMKFRDSYNFKSSSNKVTCYTCGIAGHKSNECYRNQNKEKKWCGFCKSKTHAEKACQKKGDDKVKRTSDDNHTYAFKIEDNEGKFHLHVDKQSYLVDCGATSHIVNEDKDFTSIDNSFKPEEHFIELANGTRSNNIAMKRGNVAICLHDEDGNAVRRTLENTLFIPSYPQCIFSV